MMTQQTLDKLYDMKLTAMAEAFSQQITQPDLGDLSFEDRFAMLVDRQWTFKEDRRMTRLLRAAKLKDGACIENIDFKTPRALDKCKRFINPIFTKSRRHGNMLLQRKEKISCQKITIHSIPSKGENFG